MNFKYLFLLTVFFTQSISALTVTDQKGKVEIDLKKDWEYDQNILGIPHLFSTKDTPERSSLSLTLTGIKGVNLPIQDLQKNQSQYQNGRKNWAKNHEATIEKFLPYTVLTNAAKVKIHVIGVEYKMAGTRYLEKSYYVECPNSFAHLKLLSPQNEQRIKEAGEMIESLKCSL